MPSDAYYRDKTVEHVLAELYDTAEVGSAVGGQSPLPQHECTMTARTPWSASSQ
jgi:hypothetical protein